MASDVPCNFPNMMALFESSVPSLETIQYVIGDIDEQLRQNDKSIEKVLQELVKATNGLSADNNYTNVKDAMDSLIHTPVLEECACLMPDPEDVNKLLKAVLHHLTSSPGSEDAIFDQLLYLASHEGLGLPIRAPKPDLVGTSALSLNSINDSKEQENDIVWEDIRSRLKRYFLEYLQKMPTTSSVGTRRIRSKRVDYLQSLCILYPEVEVWASYQQLRSQQVINTIRKLLGGKQRQQHQDNSRYSKSDTQTPMINTPPQFSLSDLAGHVKELVLVIQEMVKEDGHLFLMKLFHGRVDFTQCIQDLYMQTLTGELQSVIGDTITRVIERDNMGHHKRKKEEVENNCHSRVLEDNNYCRRVSEDCLLDTKVERAKVQLCFDEMTALITIMTGLASLDAYLRHLFYQVTRDFAPPIGPHKPKSSIKGVLKNSPRDSGGYDTKVRGGECDFGSQKGIMPDAIPPPFGVTTCMMSTNSKSSKPKQTVLDSPSKKLHWNWIDMLSDIVPDVIASLTKLIDDTVQTSLNQEEEAFQQYRCVNEVPVCRDLVNGSLDFPKVISVSLAELVSALENLMPLAILASEGVMKAIRTAFTDAIEYNFTHIFETLSNRLQTINSTQEDSESNVYISVTEVYKILSAAVFSTSYLTHVQSVLIDDHTKRCLSGIHKQLNEFANNAVDVVKDYHSNVISMSILYDAEGNNWTDQRPFFEGERVSFTIQMWNLHMKALQQELFASCPPRYAQKILALVLRDSLRLLSQRYSRAMPTYKRTKQFRSDITTILLITLDSLWSAANSVQALVDHQITTQPYADIHNCCICLLTTMAVVASPLQDFYKVYKKGFQHKRLVLKDAEKEGMHMVTPWMAWIRMDVFHGCEKGFDGLQKRCAVYILLQLLANQPSPNYAIVLQALLIRENLLPVLLVRNVDQRLGASSQDSLSSTSPNASGCGGICCPGEYCYSNQGCEIPDIAQPLMDVLVLCTDHPNALANVLIAMIEKDDDMSVFDTNCVAGKTASVPPWLACVFELLSAYIDGAVTQSIISLVCEPQNEDSVGFLDSLRELPCGCRPKHTMRTSAESDIQELQYLAMWSLIERLSSDVLTLPMPICVFFATLQQNLSTKGIKSTRNCPAIQVIANCLYNKFHDAEALEELIGRSLESSTLKHLAMIGDYSQQILMCDTAGGHDGMAQEAIVFLKKHSVWLEKSINRIVQHLSNSLFVDCAAYPLEDSPYEFVDHYMTELADSVCRHTKGKKSLLQVYHILTNNMDWLQYQLEVPPALPIKDAPTIPQFTLDVPPPLHSSSNFNPLVSFNSIGDSPFDHDALADFSIDWLKLLQSDMGLSVTGLRNLLSHRHDVQEDAYLNDVEKKPVRVLKMKYGLDSDDLV